MSALVKWDWRLRGQSGDIEVYSSEDPEDPGISIAGMRVDAEDFEENLNSILAAKILDLADENLRLRIRAENAESQGRP